jgi:CubicO group peptidase (beta-lactamase class C family)
MLRRILQLCVLALPALLPPSLAAPTAAALDAEVQRALARTHAHGLAIGIVDHGKVAAVRAWGIRNAAGAPLTTHTILYGASLTKAVFAYGVMTLVDRGQLDLDAPLATLLPKPIDTYPGYQGLASDDRWKRITPRMALTHSTGLANFAFTEPDHQLHIHFDPGSRYAYSGAGLLLLQMAIEQHLHLDMRAFTDEYLARLHMTRTAFSWREDFAAELADGFDDQGHPVPHDRRSSVRVAGSMDTTIQDLTTFAAALVRGAGLSPRAHAEMLRAQLPITTAHQFPTLQPELPPPARRADLAAGLGVVTFQGPLGPGFYKGGHDEQTANTLVCLERQQRCVVILSNDVRAEASYAQLVTFVLGDTHVPYDWEYGDGAGKSNP